MNDNAWALLAIIAVAVVYEIDRKIGLLFFFIVFLAMAFRLQARRVSKGGGYSWETPIPPTVH